MTPAALKSFRIVAQRVDQSLHGDIIAISGTEYACAVDYGSIAPMPTERGYEDHQTATVRVVKSLMESMPTRTDTFALNGHTWRLDGIGGQDPTALCWVLTLDRRVK